MDIGIWLWIALAASLVTTAVVLLTGRKLSRADAKRHNKRYGGLGLVPVLTILAFSAPHISSTSSVRFRDDIEQVKMTSINDASLLSRQHTSHINDLRDEVSRLREEVAEANSFYKNVTFGLLIGMIGVIVGRAVERLESET